MMLTTKIFLAIVGGAYALLAAWCAIAPEQTANSVGFQLRRGSGQSEYFVVYGGLQMALGVAFLWPLINKDFLSFSLWLCLVVHALLVGFRMVSFVRFTGIESTTYYLSAIEIAIFLGALWRFLAHRS